MRIQHGRTIQEGKSLGQFTDSNMTSSCASISCKTRLKDPHLFIVAISVELEEAKSTLYFHALLGQWGGHRINPAKKSSRVLPIITNIFVLYESGMTFSQWRLTLLCYFGIKRRYNFTCSGTVKLDSLGSKKIVRLWEVENLVCV